MNNTQEYFDMTSKIKQLEGNKERFRKIELFVDMDNADRTFEQYGQITAPVMVLDRYNRWSHNSDYKTWLDKDNYRKLLRRQFPFYPHEALETHLGEVIDHQIKEHNLELKIQQRYDAHRGDTRFWTLLSDEVFYINPDNKEDGIKLGVVVRNGIGTNVALGVDLYTYRLVCSNGAVARDKTLGAFSLSHVGNYERIVRVFVDSINLAFEKVKELLKYYREMTKINITPSIANFMYKKLWDVGDVYFPSQWELPQPKDVAELRKKGQFSKMDNLVKVDNKDNKQNLWDVFNEFTAQYKDRLHSKKIAFPRVAENQARLHNVAIALVQENRNRHV